MLARTRSRDLSSTLIIHSATEDYKQQTAHFGCSVFPVCINFGHGESGHCSNAVLVESRPQSAGHPQPEVRHRRRRAADGPIANTVSVHGRGREGEGVHGREYERKLCRCDVYVKKEFAHHGVPE